MSASNERLSTGSGVKKSAAIRFINEPKSFNGDTTGSNAAVTWLNRMRRLKLTAKLTDEEILYIVGDHVVDKAETWWNVVGSKATTWDEFEGLFKKHYLADQEDKWWQQLQEIKQGKDYPTVDDVSLKMQELFVLVDNKSQSYQVRTFLNSLRPKLAFEVEKNGTPVTFVQAVEQAKQIEKSSIKYGIPDSDGTVFGDYAAQGSNASVSGSFTSNVSEVSVSNSMASLVEKLEKLSINLVKLTGDQGNGVVHSQQQASGTRRPFVCFHCNQPGHKKYDCPEFNKNVATGSNAIPIGGGNQVGDGNAQSQGKANERQ